MSNISQFSQPQRFSILYHQDDPTVRTRRNGTRYTGYGIIHTLNDLSGGDVKDFILESPLFRNARHVSIDYYYGMPPLYQRFKVRRLPDRSYRIEWEGESRENESIYYFVNTPEDVYRKFSLHFPGAVGGKRRSTRRRRNRSNRRASKQSSRRRN